MSTGHAALFDQAGLMLRAGPETWLKTGLEVTFRDLRIGEPISRRGLE